MRQETYTLSQKELQRVSVISACIKGDMACARAAGLLCLSVRQIKRLKKRMREDGEAALAHANRGRASHRRLPDAVRADRAAIAQHLCWLQRPPSVREAGRARGLFAQSRNTAPSAAQERSWLASPAPCSRSSPAPRAFCAARRTSAARRQPARLARRTWPAAHCSWHAG